MLSIDIREVVEAANHVVSGKFSDCEFAGAVVVNDLFEALEANGFEKQNVFETNGWDWDWWETFTKDSVSVRLSGSGYYGGIRVYNND